MDAEAEENAQYETEQQVFPALSNFAERLDENLWKAYQRTQHGNISYMVRLQDENRLLFLSDKLFAFLTQYDQLEDSARIGLIKLQYIYFKHDEIYSRVKAKFAQKNEPVNASIYICEDSTKVI